MHWIGGLRAALATSTRAVLAAQNKLKISADELSQQDLENKIHLCNNEISQLREQIFSINEKMRRLDTIYQGYRQEVARDQEIERRKRIIIEMMQGIDSAHRAENFSSTINQFEQFESAVGPAPVELLQNIACAYFILGVQQNDTSLFIIAES